MPISYKFLIFNHLFNSTDEPGLTQTDLNERDSWVHRYHEYSTVLAPGCRGVMLGSLQNS